MTERDALARIKAAADQAAATSAVDGTNTAVATNEWFRLLDTIYESSPEHSTED